jgi:hypothetical protein
MSSSTTHTQPVGDTVAKVNDEVAVGSDLEFQQKWWRFTRTLWIVFAILIVADLLGCFGRGFVANAHARTSDGAMNVRYERIERFSSPSIFRIEFGPAAIRDGKIRLWVGESVIKCLGAQRVVPQPESSVIGQGGITYTFPASTIPAFVEFALEPTGPGIYTLPLRIPGSSHLSPKIFVMP